MLRKVLSLLLFFGFLANGNLIAQSNLFTNGSLDGTVSIGATPTNWNSYSSTSPDVCNISDPTLGGDGSPKTTATSSTDGGTWVGFHDLTDFAWEGLWQNISLEGGKTYTISFEQANFGAVYGGSDFSNNGKVEVFIDAGSAEPTTLVGDGGAMSLGTQWNNASVTFTTTVSGAHSIGFRAKTTSGDKLGAYLSIDGITIVEQNNTSGNNCPVANDDGNIVNEGELTVGNVFDNDSDADGDLLQIVAMIKLPDHGSLTSNSSTGEYVYQHYGEEEFSDIFTYVVSDGNCTDTADVVIITLNMQTLIMDYC